MLANGRCNDSDSDDIDSSSFGTEVSHVGLDALSRSSSGDITTAGSHAPATSVFSNTPAERSEGNSASLDAFIAPVGDVGWPLQSAFPDEEKTEEKLKNESKYKLAKAIPVDEHATVTSNRVVGTLTSYHEMEVNQVTDVKVVKGTPRRRKEFIGAYKWKVLGVFALFVAGAAVAVVLGVTLTRSSPVGNPVSSESPSISPTLQSIETTGEPIFTNQSSSRGNFGQRFLLTKRAEEFSDVERKLFCRNMELYTAEFRDNFDGVVNTTCLVLTQRFYSVSVEVEYVMSYGSESTNVTTYPERFQGFINGNLQMLTEDLRTNAGLHVNGSFPAVSLVSPAAPETP